MVTRQFKSKEYAITKRMQSQEKLNFRINSTSTFVEIVVALSNHYPSFFYIQNLSIMKQNSN